MNQFTLYSSSKDPLVNGHHSKVKLFLVNEQQVKLIFEIIPGREIVMSQPMANQIITMDARIDHYPIGSATSWTSEQFL
jgi:hypothetical protein